MRIGPERVVVEEENRASKLRSTSKEDNATTFGVRARVRGAGWCGLGFTVMVRR